MTKFESSPMITRLVWFSLGLAVGVIVGYYIGMQAEENREADITIQMQEEVLDVHTNVYNSLPRSRAESFEWLFKHTD